MKILIDNGHGSTTKGKRSPDGQFQEYAYAREIAEAVTQQLQERGYDAIRIVPEEEDVPLVDRVSRANKICGEVGTNNVILVSIHCNAAGSGNMWYRATGWSCYTTKGVTKSDDLAKCLYDVAEEQFKGQRIRISGQDEQKDWEENFYVLRKTKCPAVLTENFFMDNKDDVKYLQSEEGKRAVITTHVEGIIKYISEYYE